MKNGANLRGWEARRLLAQCGCRNADGLEELEQVGTFACGNREGSQEGGIQGVVRDRNGAQNTSVEEEENMSVLRTIRIELALSRNLEKEKSVETRETLGQDQGECGDGESPKKTQSKHFNWNSIAKDENPGSLLTKFFQNLYSIPEDQEECLTKFRPIAGPVCDAESFGLCMAQVTPSTEIRECAKGICAKDACGRWIVSAAAGSRVVERVAKKNCGCATGREESVRPCGPSSGL